MSKKSLTSRVTESEIQEACVTTVGKYYRDFQELRREQIGFLDKLNSAFEIESH